MILGIGFRRIRKVGVDGRVEWTLDAGEPMMSGSSLTPSPDGRKIAYRETLDPLGPWSGPEFRKLPARFRILTLGTPLVDEVLTDASDPESKMIGWSADSERVVLSIGGEIRTYSVATGKYVAIGHGVNPSWSPDGKTIAWTGVSQHGVLFDTQTSKPIEILGREKTVFGMKWSPDSRYLLACIKQLHRFGDTVLVVVRASDGTYVKVLEPSFGITNRDYGWVLLPKWRHSVDPGLVRPSGPQGFQVSVMIDDYHVYYGDGDTALTGVAPGLGVAAAPVGSGFESVSFYNYDAALPLQVDPAAVASSITSSSVDFQWKGVASGSGSGTWR